MNNANLTCEHIRTALKSGAQLLDVRSPQEFAQGALPNAVNMPIQQLTQNVQSIDVTRPVLIYCVSGQRSEMAAQTLRQQGFKDVTNIGAHASYQTC